MRITKMGIILGLLILLAVVARLGGTPAHSDQGSAMNPAQMADPLDR